MIDLTIKEARVDTLPEDRCFFLQASKFDVFQLICILLGAFEEVVLSVIVLGG